jgi:hypothetical protein
MAFNLNDYEPVANRIARFWADHPEGAIYSELIYDDGERCVVKATVHFIKGEPAVSSDYAEEMKTERGVNATSRIENCCTSAQEMQKVERLSTPTDTRQNPVHIPSGAFATPKQIGYIKKLAKDGGYDDLRLLELIQRELNSDEAVLELLKSHEASRIIEVLK